MTCRHVGDVVRPLTSLERGLQPPAATATPPQPVSIGPEPAPRSPPSPTGGRRGKLPFCLLPLPGPRAVLGVVGHPEVVERMSKTSCATCTMAQEPGVFGADQARVRLIVTRLSGRGPSETNVRCLLDVPRSGACELRQGVLLVHGPGPGQSHTRQNPHEFRPLVLSVPADTTQLPTGLTWSPSSLKETPFAARFPSPGNFQSVFTSFKVIPELTRA